MGSANGTEIELKLRVDDLAALMRLCVTVGTGPAFTAVQRNEFLDTAHRTLDRQRFVLRVRTERSPTASTTFLTAKGPSRRSDDRALRHVPEQEIEIADDIAADLRNGRADAFAVLLAGPGTDDLRRALVEQMRSAVAGAPLTLVGGFTTERTRLPVQFPTTSTAPAFAGVLELDRVTFPGDQIHHEVEFEVPPGVDVEVARAAFLALFDRAGVTGRPAPGKASRFFRALAGERLD
jgi:uncharacterized protein YjbK